MCSLSSNLMMIRENALKRAMSLTGECECGLGALSARGIFSPFSFASVPGSTCFCPVTLHLCGNQYLRVGKILFFQV